MHGKLKPVRTKFCANAFFKSKHIDVYKKYLSSFRVRMVSAYLPSFSYKHKYFFSILGWCYTGSKEDTSYRSVLATLLCFISIYIFF